MVMPREKIRRGDGFGPLGLLFLAAVLYLLLSLSIGFATRGDTKCRAGYDREWRFAPPGWVCR
jgi:hypothetical protein